MARRRAHDKHGGSRTGGQVNLYNSLAAAAAGWATVIAITLAAFPAVYALSRMHPRELLGAVKG